MDLPQEIFGMVVSTGGNLALDGYPLFYRVNYGARRATAGKREFVALEPLGPVKPAQIEKVAAAVESGEGLPCLVVVPGATAYQRRSLSERGVAWIASDNTFHIPFLAASSDPSELRIRRAGALSARAQQVACHLIDGSWEGLTTTDVADELGVSLSSAVNYLGEIAAVLPGCVAARGRGKRLTRGGKTAAELYGTLAPLMGTPVASRTYLKLRRGLTAPAALGGLPASGLTALSRETMLADSRWETRAVWSKSAAIGGLRDACEEVTQDDEPDYLLETWRYDPGRGAVVDGVPLLLDLEDIASRDDDERLEAAIGELRERVLR